MSLILDLNRFRGGVEPVERQFEPSAFSLTEEDFSLTAPVVFSGEIRKDGQKFRLVGRVRTTLETPCSRCVEPFAIPVDAQVDLLFLPSADTPPSVDHQMSDEDVAVSFYEDNQIDLGQVLQEQFYLALPMKPLCRPDCQGLCPVCGINRNREQCQCQPSWVDPRLEPLRRLRGES